MNGIMNQRSEIKLSITKLEKKIDPIIGLTKTTNLNFMPKHNPVCQNCGNQIKYIKNYREAQLPFCVNCNEYATVDWRIRVG